MLWLSSRHEPLTGEHGGPVRLLVPGWYGMASVKWLRRVQAIDHPLEAHYQTRQYRYYGDEPVGTPGAPPVAAMRVNSLVSSPAPGDVVDPGGCGSGAAWAGGVPVVAVEVSVDAGGWEAAELVSDPEPYAWRRWRFPWPGAAPGRHSIRSRATAADGAVQPDLPDWTASATATTRSRSRWSRCAAGADACERGRSRDAAAGSRAPAPSAGGGTIEPCTTARPLARRAPSVVAGSDGNAPLGRRRTVIAARRRRRPPTPSSPPSHPPIP